LKDVLAFLNWYGIITLVGVFSLPIAFRFFPRLASRGYAFLRPLSLLIWGYSFWMLGSLGILQNDLGGVLLGLGILVICSFVLLRGDTRNQIKEWFNQSWKTVVVVEVVFFVFFAGWTIVRAANPEAAYTEKPMELAFINSILQSDSFPPPDPWLSGYAISYYYFGYILVSMLTRVTGVASSVAFNLSSSLWFGMTAAAAYGVGHDLIHAWQTRKSKAGETINDTTIKKISRSGGLLGPFFLLLLGNLEGLLEILYAKRFFWTTAADGTFTSRFWSWLQILELNTAPTQPASWLPNRSTGWIWWRGSRVIQDVSMSGGNIEVIDEFPFFTYLLSDLHPHLLAMPFCLLAIALALNLFLSIEKKDVKTWASFRWMPRWESWLTVLILGSLAFLNTWDFPIYVGLFAVVILYKRIREAGWYWGLAWEFLLNGLVLGVTGVVLFLPFYIGFQSQAGGILPSLEYMTRGVNFWVMFGIFLSLLLIWLIYTIRQKEIPFSLVKGIKFAAFCFLSLFLLSTLWGLILFNLSAIGENLASFSNATLGVLGEKLSALVTNLPDPKTFWDVQIFNLFTLWGSKTISANATLTSVGEKMIMGGQAFSGLHGNYSVLAIIQESITRRIVSPGAWLTLAVMLTLVWGLLNGKKQPEKVNTENEPSVVEQQQEPNIKIFVLILTLIGLGLTIFPEYFYLRDQFGSRMNTIFKFYFQAWMFWSIAAAFASIELLAELKRWKLVLFSVFWTGLIVAGMAYPVVMLLNKTSNFSPIVWTLDGNEYISRYNPDDYLAFNWLATQDYGIVAEAVGGSYTDYARISTRSGFPTVLGWPGHESQWRGGATEMGSRAADISILYETQSADETLAIIQKYRIQYVYVGNLELIQYKVAREKFDALFDLIYSNGSVTIYEVPPHYGK
jgi:YYY domain-containing protein